jgi:hypothetical protein
MSHSIIRSQLEEAITHAKLDLYVVPMVDEFQGEYVPAYAARLPFITGFDGSAGLGVFRASPSEAGRHVLFVDGRYTLQAANQVDGAAIEIINSGETSFLDWLANQPGNPRIGFDPWLVTQAQREGWAKATAARAVTWVSHRPNLVDLLWSEQPSPPQGDVELHDIELAGASYESKRRDILALLKKHGADSVLLTQADSINWLLNIRGSDVPFNPLLLAHMVLRADGSSTLFMHPHTLDSEVGDYFDAQSVSVASLADVFLGKIAKEVMGASVMIDATATAAGWFDLAESMGVRIIRETDPTLFPNVQSILFKDHEGAFLVGMIAGKISHTNLVGFVGGMDIPLIRNFALGFTQGVKYAAPDLAVDVQMVGPTAEAWSNPEKAKALAQMQYREGADIVFAAAGGSSLGVLQAANEMGKLAIGVDSNQNGLFPGHVLTSLVKRVDVAVYDTLKNSREGTWSAGIKYLGIKEGALDYAVDQNNSGLISEKLIEEVATAKDKIISGKIVVESYSAK